jgi:hypothetical protein
MKMFYWYLLNYTCTASLFLADVLLNIGRCFQNLAKKALDKMDHYPK